MKIESEQLLSSDEEQANSPILGYYLQKNELTFS